MPSSSPEFIGPAEIFEENTPFSARVLLSLLEAEILVGKEKDGTISPFLEEIEGQKNVKLEFTEVKEGCSDRILFIRCQDRRGVSEALVNILEIFTGNDGIMVKLLQQEHKFHFLKILLPPPFEFDYENVTDKNQLTTIRLLFSNSETSAIIGRNGEMIKKLMHENDVRILASKHYLPDSEDRVLEVQGLPFAIAKAWLQISQLNKESKSENSSGGIHLERKYFPHLAKALRGSVNRSVEFKAIVLIPEKFVGALVGKGGNRIANLRKYTKTKIIIESKSSAKEKSAGERVFIIIGNLERNVIIAEKMIFNNLEAERKRRQTNFSRMPPGNST